MIIRSIQEAEAALLPYVPLVASAKAETTLDRVWPLMELLGNPQDQLKIVHIAGTSGKTSTAYYMAALLAASHQQVGLTVSPHVDSLLERVQINGPPLTEAAFCAALGEFLDIIHTAQQQPSYFELLYAFALWMFARNGVDYAVVETGMGGLHDATNVARRQDKVCIITDIGLDHTHILGSSLPEIAKQKFGIVHEHNQVFMYQQAPEIMAVAEQWTHQHHATLQVTSLGAELETVRDDMPDYQRRNWLLAHRVYRYILDRDKLPEVSWEDRLQTQYVQVPARMEIKHIGDKTVVMDGAHNAQKMTAFLKSFQKLYPDTKPAILLGLKAGKEYETLIPLLAPLASRVITTVFNTTQDLPVQSMDPDILAQAFTAQGVPAESIADQAVAVQALLQSSETVCVITGSFYMLSQIRNNGYLA